MKIRVTSVPSNAAKIASSLLLAFLLYRVVLVVPWDPMTVRNASKSISSFRAPNPRGYYDTQSIGEDDVSLLRRMKEPTSTLGTKNVTSLPSALYQMAKPVFDALPDKFLPGYKSPCWMIRTKAMNNRIRCLPYFYILGAPKCGTSDLWNKIGGHPDVIGGIVKEPHWWTRRRLDGLESFESYLQRRSAKLVDKFNQDASNKDKLIVGDGSASTLWDNHDWIEAFGVRNEGPEFVTAQILHAVQPNAKLFVILREPVSRLYSGHLYFNRNPDPGRFHDDTVETIARFRRCTATLSARACAYTISQQKGVRLNIGLYAIYIRDWLKVFPRDQMFILRLEDWHKECTEILPNIYAFLNLKNLSEDKIMEICHTKTKNTNLRTAHKVGDMFNETRTMLQEFYSGWNRELSELLGDERFLWH